MINLQQKRLALRSAFFLLFLLAPILDIFRFDLNEDHFILLWHPWVLGINASMAPMDILWNMLTRFLLPISLIIGTGIYISWKWGRLYCGWLCPHFSVVEMINSAMRRASGKLSIWDKEKLPDNQQDGTHVKSNKWWWIVTALIVFLFSFIWAVVLLTYLLPPKEIYANLFSGNLTRNQFTFITVATILLIIEFTFARHLFCRFGCAIGLFQSMVWMGNQKAMVVGFDRKRVVLCADCDKSCEHACPMRLKPRGLKRNKFTCTQCMQCVTACENVQDNNSKLPLLKMLDFYCAHDVSDRGFGHRPDVPTGCFKIENKGKMRCECENKEKA
ncbi:MAG: 4Fe-4S binding protein [Pseudomonadota bacterium]